MNENSLKNLKPFTGRNDPRRQNGRKKGQINRATVIRGLLQQEVDLNEIFTLAGREVAGRMRGKTYLECITLALMNRSLAGDTQASNIIFRELRDIEKNHPPERDPDYVPEPISIQIVDGRETAERLEAVERRLRQEYDYDYSEDVLEIPTINSEYEEYLRAGNFNDSASPPTR